MEAIEESKPREIVVELSRILRNGTHHLDVGCGGGALLDFSRGKGCLTTGVDYSAITREHLECKGHAWFPSLESLGERTFDVITAFDLIEHLYDVGAFLRDCCLRLRPGGQLVVLTGSIDCRSAQIAGAHWWYVAYPEHIVFPSRLFFKSLSDFKLETWLPTYAAAQYNYPIYRVLLSYLKRKALRKKYTGLPSRSPDHALIVLTKVDV
jgi:SAM-dependent methyltransferase